MHNKNTCYVWCTCFFQVQNFLESMNEYFFKSPNKQCAAVKPLVNSKEAHIVFLSFSSDLFTKFKFKHSVRISVLIVPFGSHFNVLTFKQFKLPKQNFCDHRMRCRAYARFFHGSYSFIYCFASTYETNSQHTFCYIVADVCKYILQNKLDRFHWNRFVLTNYISKQTYLMVYRINISNRSLAATTDAMAGLLIWHSRFVVLWSV